MKYRTQSANVLNESDRFERQLDWMLFTQEQEQLLWGEGNLIITWRPGDFLFQHPHEVERGYCTCDTCTEDMMPHGYEGNCVRPMFQVFEPDRDDTMDGRVMRCIECDVDWIGEDACFVCFEKRPDPRYWSRARESIPGLQHRFYEAMLPVGHVERVEETMQGLRADFVMSDDFDIDYNQYRFTMEARQNGRVLAATTQRMNREDLVAGDLGVIEWLQAEMRVMLETQLAGAWRRVMDLGDMRHYSIAVPTVTEQAEETQSCDEFDGEFSVESLFVQDDPPTTPMLFTLPSNLDLSGRRSIEPPAISFSSGEGVRTAERYWADTPITETRRTR